MPTRSGEARRDGCLDGGIPRSGRERTRQELHDAVAVVGVRWSTSNRVNSECGTTLLLDFRVGLDQSLG